MTADLAALKEYEDWLDQQLAISDYNEGIHRSEMSEAYEKQYEKEYWKGESHGNREAIGASTYRPDRLSHSEH